MGASSVSAQMMYGIIAVGVVCAINLLIVVALVLHWRKHRTRRPEQTPTSSGLVNGGFRPDTIRSFDSLASKFSANSYEGDNYLSNVAESS